MMIAIKATAFALLATCGAHFVQPEKAPPPPPPQEGQAFCCTSVDKKTKSGEGCGAISQENINACGKVLYCSGDYTKDDGTVTCLD